MADGRRLGHAQRRRIGAPSNSYANTMKPPTFGPGDQVKAQGRYGTGTVTRVWPNVAAPGNGHDGHGYEVTGGKMGRSTWHLSGELHHAQPTFEAPGRLNNGEVVI